MNRGDLDFFRTKSDFLVLVFVVVGAVALGLFTLAGSTLASHALIYAAGVLSGGIVAYILIRSVQRRYIIIILAAVSLAAFILVIVTSAEWTFVARGFLFGVIAMPLVWIVRQQQRPRV